MASDHKTIKPTENAPPETKYLMILSTTQAHRTCTTSDQILMILITTQVHHSPTQHRHTSFACSYFRHEHHVTTITITSSDARHV
uniref:Uncharacterized protein n=1 Tax=Arundo donax TaxID=35708 RepID=A0A0A9DDW7_ARUDO